jgi:homoserine kinase
VIRVKIRVPATSANLGPGFDCLGIALGIYNEVVIEETGSGRIDITWAPGNDIIVPRDKNLVYTAFVRAMDILGFEHHGVSINMSKRAIPIGKGLGSSAASVVAGVLGANQIAGEPLSFEEIIDVATAIEGHPDNVVPALVGGMTVAVQEGSRVCYSKVRVPGNLRFVAMVPGFTLDTSSARQALPTAYSRDDAVFNLSRAAMLVSCLQNGEFHSLRMATEDKIHQPFRMRLIPGAPEIFNELKEAGSLAEFVSGAGPTIMAMADGDSHAEPLLQKMKAFRASKGSSPGSGQSEIASGVAAAPGATTGSHKQWSPMILKPDLSGAIAELL